MKRVSTRVSAMVFALVALTVAVQFARPARAAVIVNESESVDGTYVTSPSGEQILLSGSIHIVLHQTTGGTIAISDLSTNLQGVSGLGLTTGTVYHLSANSQTHAIVADDDDPSVFHFTDARRFITEGSEDNVRLLISFIITVNNANGTVTVDIDRIDTDIVG